MRVLLATALAVSVAVALPYDVGAGGKHETRVLDAFPAHLASDWVCPLGETGAGGDTTTASYYGQTFVLPQVAAAQSLFFAMTTTEGTGGPDGTDFRVLVTESSGSAESLRPSNVIFESRTMTLSPGAPLTEFTVDLGGLRLEAGRTYFWILDSWVAFDGVVGASCVVGRAGLYAGGEFYATNAGAAGFESPGTRADHFAAMNPPFDDFDLGFKLTYLVSGRHRH